MESQTPSLPDPSTLKDLPPSVAITFLIVALALALLVYIGGPIRDRLKRKPDAEDPRPSRTSDGALSQVPAPAAAGDAAERRTDQFIDNLLRQVENCSAENVRLEHRIEEIERAAAKRAEDYERLVQQLRDERQQLREENQQLRMQVMWQRGPHQ